MEGTGLGGDILPLDRAALSVALGRDNVVHLALTDAAAANRIAAPLERLLHFQGRAEANGAEPNGAESNGSVTGKLAGSSAAAREDELKGVT
jgi:hypothetical protein